MSAAAQPGLVVACAISLASLGCGRYGFAPMGTVSDAATGDTDSDTGSATVDANDAQVGDASTLLDGLIAHYPLDDASFAAGAADATGNNHTAQCTQCPNPSSGRIGGAALFSGSNSLTVPFAAAFNTTSGFTVAAWARPTDLSSALSIFAKPHSASATANSWQLEFQTSTNYRFKLRSATLFDDELVATGVSLNTWQHVAGTWDGTKIVLYINGVLQGEAPMTDIVFDTGALYIGADFNNGSTAELFDGQIDDVRLYDRGLTASEIASLANP